MRKFIHFVLSCSYCSLFNELSYIPRCGLLPLRRLSMEVGSLLSKLADILLWLMVLRLIPSSVELEDRSISWLWGLSVDLGTLVIISYWSCLNIISAHLSLVLVSTLTESLSLASSNFLSSSSM